MSKRSQPPLKHPVNWLPYADALSLTLRCTGPLELALDELHPALESGDLSSKLVEREGEEFKHTLLSKKSWQKVEVILSTERVGERQELTASWREELEIRLRGEPDDPRRLLFVWKPDLERLLGIEPSPERREVMGPSEPGEATGPQRRRGRPGPKPKGDWYEVVGARLIHIAVVDPTRLRHVDNLVEDARSFLNTEIKWAPKEDKELRQIIVRYLRFINR